MKSRKRRGLARSTFGAAVSLSLLAPASPPGAQELSTAPAGSAFKAPAPNVILSIDNSKRMGAAGMDALRQALQAAIAATPDGAVRLGWQSSTAPLCPDAACSTLDGVRVLDSRRRAQFTAWLKGLRASGDSPSHRLMRSAGEYLRLPPTGADSAWAGVPGRQVAPLLGCRRAYNVFVTRGGWNALQLPADDSVGDADATRRTLPDGTLFDPDADAMRIYQGRHSGQPSMDAPAIRTTLSDLAFHYWATDLQPALPDDVRPRMRTHGDAGIAGSPHPRPGEIRPGAWNPENDPATWQHMTTHTVGLGPAADWRIPPRFGHRGETDGDYPRLVAGELHWPNPITGSEDQERITELWHMALNSRGRFIPATDPDSLDAALRQLMDDIQGSRRSLQLASLAASSRSTASDAVLFAAAYNAGDWSGTITAHRLRAGTAALESAGPWGEDAAAGRANGSSVQPAPRTAASIMDAHDDAWPQARQVLSARTSDAASPSVGISWEWRHLSDASKTALMSLGGVLDTGKDAARTAQDRLAYLRGDRRLEQSRMPNGPFRDRGSRLGDIVHSKLWYQPGEPTGAYGTKDHAEFRAARRTRPSMLYVGANDGMLHAFDAATGEERFAYVPEGLHPKLAELTRPAYTHAYYVDGSPLTGDVYLGGPGNGDAARWKTYLAGFPGAGGKGYFVLDVTDPESFVAQRAADLVVLDRTHLAQGDRDIGHITGDPVTEAGDPTLSRQITRLNDGRWALVTGNGYRSIDEKAVLLVQYLDGAKELLKLAADTKPGLANGLGPPRLIDLNGDRIPDVAYAGDLRGRLWKFDLGAPSSRDWKLAFGGNPLFVARNAKGQPQPVTSAPVWKPHPDGGLMIAFGTGQNLSDADRDDASPQTIYGIRDRTGIERKPAHPVTGGSIVRLDDAGLHIRGGREQLVAQEVNASGRPDASGSSTLWTLSSHPVSDAGRDPKQGWYLDLPIPRERVLQNPGWFDGNLIDVWSTVPATSASQPKESCEPHVASDIFLRTTLDILSGSAPTSRIYAQAPADAPQASRLEVGHTVGLRSDRMEFGVTVPGGRTSQPVNLLGRVMKRPSWRQLQ